MRRLKMDKINKMDKRFGIKREFSATEIRQIREEYLKGKTQQQLASDWGVSQKTVAFIIKRYTYPSLGVPDNYDDRLRERMGKYWEKRYRRKETNK
jgi:DNA-binding XRE family transcriptional regulator